MIMSESIQDRADAKIQDAVLETTGDLIAAPRVSTLERRGDSVVARPRESFFGEGQALEEYSRDTFEVRITDSGTTVESPGDSARLRQLFADAGVTGDNVEAVLEAIANEADGERYFTTNAPGNAAAERSITLYESENRENIVGNVLIGDEQFSAAIGETLREAGPDAIPDGESFSAGDIQDATQDARSRTANREAARKAAEGAGVDLEEFGIDARADGTVVLQDRDTGQTRTIDADTSDGLGAALDAETSGGEFIADAADPAARGTSGGGLGARAVAAIVLLLGAIAAAVGWSE
jgi:hypothetical protein